MTIARAGILGALLLAVLLCTGAQAGSSSFDVEALKAKHWAWQPIRVTQPPVVKDAAWCRSDIDRFILARLEEKGLKPAPPADKRTLLRRAYFDLIGLPPTPRQIDDFLADTSPDAFARVVDGLLADPHFGERWARHWLDLVRYAETRGHEFDYDIPNAFEYRDYVIRALNADVPYDQFVVEQVAGDLMPKPRLDPTGTVNESIVGTGFWFLGEWVHSPVDIRGDETNRVDNQIDVFGKAFLGLTIGCARCHNHKFDAISQKDYYALAGFLSSSSFRDVQFKYGQQNRDLLTRITALNNDARHHVLHALSPTMDHIGDYLVAAAQCTDASRASAEAIQRVAAERKIDPVLLKAWVEAVQRAEKVKSDPLYVWAVLSRQQGAATPEQIEAALKTALSADSAPAADAKASLIVDYAHVQSTDWMTDGYAFGSAPAPAGEICLDDRPDHPLAIRQVGSADNARIDPRLPGMLRTRSFTLQAPRLWYHVRGAGNVFACVDSHRMIAGPLHGQTKLTISAAQTQAGWTWISQDLHDYVGQRIEVEFTPTGPAGMAIASVWQGDSRPPAPVVVPWMAEQLMKAPPRSKSALAQRLQQLLTQVSSDLINDRLAQGNNPAGRAPVGQWLLDNAARLGLFNPAADPIHSIITHASQQRAKLLADFKQSPTAMAMLDGTGWNEHILSRGNHQTPAEIAPRQFLEAIAGPHQPPIERGSGRLVLARQMIDPSDPLLPRVMVNRIWQHLLGRGIVASVDNFGVMGEKPTYPELLDNLAHQFVKARWSIKSMIRAIMLSSTYQMSSRHDRLADEADPDDRLLHRARIRRLEGEAIRDAMLSISGRLDGQMYGPSVEVHLTDFMEGRGRPGGSGPLDGNGRRSIYIKVRRNFLPPMMLAFDQPVPFSCMGHRTVSNVPAQALTLLNDPFVEQLADLWAHRVLADKDLTPAQRIREMYEQAYARPPTPRELESAQAFIHDSPDGASAPRTWSELAHVLMNVKEFVFLQ